MYDLVKKWRNDSGEHYGAWSCARDLESLLPKWTLISEDESTWPKKAQDVLLSIGPGFLEAGEWAVSDNSMKKYIDRYWWRPLCSIDRPPE